MKFPSRRGAGVVTFRYCIDDCPKEEYNHLERDPTPPQEVLVFGFPLDIGLELAEPRPMARQGLVALTADEKFLKLNGRYVEEKAFLVDVKMFRGNSGSPVLTLPGVGRKLYLYGLIFATNPALDFAVGEPASRIREVIDIARSQDANFDAWFPLGENPTCQ